jgi:hypothetical protein
MHSVSVAGRMIAPVPAVVKQAIAVIQTNITMVSTTGLLMVIVAVVLIVPIIVLLVAVIVPGEIGRLLGEPLMIQSMRAAEPVAVGHEMLLRFCR